MTNNIVKFYLDGLVLWEELTLREKYYIADRYPKACPKSFYLDEHAL